MTWVECVSAVLGLACVFLAGRNSKANFWVGYLYNAFLLALCWKTKLYSAMILCILSFAINAFGHWRWTHPREEERSGKDGRDLRVSRIEGPALFLCIAIASALSVLWAFFLKSHTDDPSPWLGSALMMATFLAQYLSAQKHWQCWLVWLAVNAGNIALYAIAGRYIMAATYGLYFLNGIWALSHWLKLYRTAEQSNDSK